MKLKIKDSTTCYICGAKQIDSSYSLHIWTIVYECGCSILGALDIKTHGDSIEVYTQCPKKEEL